MKRLLHRLIVPVSALLILLGCWSYYRALFPTALDRAYSRLKFSLNLSWLPWSVKVQGHGSDVWTDVLYELDLSINPNDLPALLRGRRFRQAKVTRMMGNSNATFIPNYQPFEIAEEWRWAESPPASSPSDFPTICTVSTNAAHNRVLVRYQAE